MAQKLFEWVVAPDVIAKGLDDYGTRAMVAIQATAVRWGQDIQNQARLKQQWIDRTGNARSGLFFAVDGFGFPPITGTVDDVGADMYITSDGKVHDRGRREDVSVESGDANTLIITLGHTVFYGKYLETSNGGIHAVVMSTIEENIPALERMLQDDFK
jgi:hypothetical protein